MDKTPNAHALKQTFNRRMFVLGAVQGGVGVLLAARMGYIAVGENEKYQMEAESNRVNLTLIPPRRGWILDRHGSPLASNQADFRVDIIPDRMEDPQREITLLASLLRLDEAEVADLREKVGKRTGSSRWKLPAACRWTILPPSACACRSCPA